jgi:hypothetical protein
MAVSHKFHVDQGVEFFPNRSVDHKAKGRYTIVRLFPTDGNIPQYRIKNKADGHERMVRENELGSSRF